MSEDTPVVLEVTLLSGAVLRSVLLRERGELMTASALVAKPDNYGSVHFIDEQGAQVSVPMERVDYLRCVPQPQERS